MRSRLLAAAILLATTGPALAQSAEPVASDLAVATFASGCFWCTEADFEKVPGVVEAVSGYTGGTVPNPTYEQVTAGATGHFESVRVRYDSHTVSYEELLDVYWRNVDPLDDGGQFCDRGSSYRSAIFYHDEEQYQAAAASKDALAESGRFDAPIVTRIEEAGPFYPAEGYHQDYAAKNPLPYSFYRWRCGRDQRLDELWAGTG
jgi:peptide-methionine (S)-S-oxide reductase